MSTAKGHRLALIAIPAPPPLKRQFSLRWSKVVAPQGNGVGEKISPAQPQAGGTSAPRTVLKKCATSVL